MSAIDPSIPPLGAPTTAGVRANFAAAKSEIEALEGRIGFADYNDTATVSTPISVSANTWTKLTNNKLGAYTKLALPAGITSLWNGSNQLDLTQVPIDGMIDLRADLIVTTSSANQTVNLRLQLGIGSPSEFGIESTEMHFKSAGAKNVVHSWPFYVGSNDIKANPGEIRIWSDSTCTVRVNGWYIRVIK